MKIIKFLSRFFKKKRIEFLGRGGLYYYSEDKKYFIDTNNYMEDKGKIKIYYNDIKLLIPESEISIIEKKRVAIVVSQELDAIGEPSEIVP